MITAIIPDLSFYQLPLAVYPQVTQTKWGDCAYWTGYAGFSVVDFPPVTVPWVETHTLADAAHILQNANLVLGSVTAGSTAPTAIVTSQDRQFGSKVPPKTVVNLNTTGAAASGIKDVTLTNELGNGDKVYVWLYDYQTGNKRPKQWKDFGCGRQSHDYSSERHFVIVMAVDPLNPNCGGNNDPSNTGARRFVREFGCSTFWGSGTGSTSSCAIGTSVCS